MQRSITRRGQRARKLVALAIAGLSAVTLVACSGGGGGNASGGDVTLKVSVFGAGTQIQDLAKAYEKANPGVKVEVSVGASSADARTNMLTKLAAGNGLADVEQVEGSWVAEIAPYANRFVPVKGATAADWVPVQSDPVTTKDGGLFGYGVGLGPDAICYRADLLEAAGMPSDPEAVADMVGGSWDDYFAAGEQYKAAGGQGAWFDSAATIYEARAGQIEYAYENSDNEIIVADNDEIRDVFDSTLAVAPELSSKLSPFSEDWNAGFASGAFATIPCPSWMLSIIEGNSVGVTGWRVANAFPGGGANSGSSFFVVPTQSKHPDEASRFALWLTEPEQQISAFQDGSAFPSRTQAFGSPDLLGVKSEFFGDAPIGQIFSDRTEAITTSTYQGPQWGAIATAVYDAVLRVETGQQTEDAAWDQFLADVDQLG